METQEKIKKIIEDLENSSNSELQFVLDYLNNDFEKTKQSIIIYTKRLDNIEFAYNKILKEFNKRTNVNSR